MVAATVEFEDGEKLTIIYDTMLEAITWADKHYNEITSFTAKTIRKDDNHEQ